MGLSDRIADDYLWERCVSLVSGKYIQEVIFARV